MPRRPSSPATRCGAPRCSKEELHALAAKLGADVPFALTGGTAIGTGRGDRLSPALATGSFHWVLAVAEFGLSTPGVYRELDRRRDGAASASRRSTRRPRSTRRCCRRCGPATRACSPTRCTTTSRPPRWASRPALGGILELGESHGALAGIVSGSGPTVAFLADDADSALELQIALSAARLNAVHVHGPVHGARIMH